jgi:hypothetical protein
MFNMRLPLITVVVICGFSVVLAARKYAPPMEVTVPAVAGRAPVEPGAAKDHATGMAGCMAAACHGAPASDLLAGKIDMNAWQASGTAWAAADPHTAAYSLLTDNPRRPVKVTAAHIMQHYAPGKKATEDARCLACHTNPALATEKLISDPHARVLREQGVSCEACHGNAGEWIQPHTAWNGDRKDVYAKTGMKPLYDIGERALACAGCHVGSPADGNYPVRDMNHDMIAAGHPRLNFDFAEYQRRLPAHWLEKDRAQTVHTVRKLNAVQVWMVGRAAHAEAACKLLADRANRATAKDERSPWPEYAEFNCAACHHDLRVDDDDARDWRKNPKYLEGRPLGAPPWQTIWPMTHAAGLDTPKRDESPTHNIILAMEKPRPASAVVVSPVASAVASDMTALRQKWAKMPGAEVEKYARGLFPKSVPYVPEWDTAGQLFFGYAALERGRVKNAKDVNPAFRDGVIGFREQDWKRVEKALGTLGDIRP